MPKQVKRAEAESVDQAGAESFPASDPPAWTLGAGSHAPTSPPGTLAAPAPRAALGFSPDADPSPADLFARLPSADSTLLWAGGAAAAAGFVLTLSGADRAGRAFEQGGIALMLVAVLRRLAQGQTAREPSLH
jgi:hypothetical protein